MIYYGYWDCPGDSVEWIERPVPEDGVIKLPLTAKVFDNPFGLGGPQFAAWLIEKEGK